MPDIIKPKIPPHYSDLDGINIEVKEFDENLAFAGKGDHQLEDWFWEVAVTNVSNPFCTDVGTWETFVVRSLIPVALNFNTRDNSSVLQFLPGEVPNKLKVEEMTLGGIMGICLVVYYHRADRRRFKYIHRLFHYQTA